MIKITDKAWYIDKVNDQEIKGNDKDKDNGEPRRKAQRKGERGKEGRKRKVKKNGGNGINKWKEGSGRKGKGEKMGK